MAARRNLYRTAVAIEYEDSASELPKIGSKGQSLMADEMVRVARRYGVPVIERPSLARALNDLEENQSIPRTLFEAVAVLLREVSQKLSTGSAARGRKGHSA